MATRSRSVLVEATIGKIFNNIVTVTTADASKLIAGATKKLTSFKQGGASKVASNLGGGVAFPAATLITSIQGTTAQSPTNKNIVVTFKTGTSYANSTYAANINFTIGVVNFGRGQSNTIDTSISIPAGTYLFCDVTQIGVGQTGANVTITYNYYSGY